MFKMIRITRSSLAIFAFAVTSFSCSSTNGAVEEAPETITPVTITNVTLKHVTSSVRLPAVTTFMKKSVIRATTTGTIETVSVMPGDYITTGQMAFRIRTREAVALYNKMINDTSMSFNGIIEIHCPQEGVINTVSFQKGDFVQEGDELATLSEQGSLVFILDVPYELDKYIEYNKRCVITLPDEKAIGGTITGRLPEMDIQSQTIRYVVKPAKGERFPSNLIASVGIVMSAKDDALVLPKKAVLGDETQTEFWVMKLINDTTAVKIIVTKGYEDNDEVEIKSPLFSVTDRILLTGNYGLADTAGVEIIPE